MAEYKKGGLTGNSNLYATNRLFVKNPLFKKRKKKAPGVYDPTAKFRYKEGGTKDKSPAYIEKDLTREEIEEYRKGGYIVEDISVPKLDRLKPGGAPCPRGQMRDASGKCVNYNWGSGNIQAADSYAGMYGGYDKSGVKNLKQVGANAKKGKKFSDYVLRGGKSRADVARNLGKNAGQYFGMSGEAIEPVNFTKAGLDKFTADVKSAKKNSEAGEKDYQNYLKSKEKVSKGKMDSSKYAKEFDQKGWSQYDVNTKEGSGSDADYSAKDARQNWGDSDEWKKFTGLVSNAATAIPLLGAAGAAGSAGAALLENPVVQGGLTAYGAYDAATNTIPEAYKDFSEGRYLEGVGNVALAGLDVVPGIGLAGKGLKGAANYGSDVIGASKNAGKLALPKYKNVYRVEHGNFDKAAIGDDLTGRWFADNPKEASNYVASLKDPKTGDVLDFGSGNPVRVIRERMPEHKINQSFGENMPEDAKIMSEGFGDAKSFDDVKEFFDPGIADRAKTANWSSSDRAAFSTAPWLYNKAEGILDADRVNALRSGANQNIFSRGKTSIFDDQYGAGDYLTNEGKRLTSQSRLKQYLPFDPQSDNLTKASEITSGIGQGVKNLGNAAKNKYVDIAEGDNIFNYAWRSPANRFDDAAIKPSYEEIMPQSQAEFDKLRSLDNLTDQQKIYLKDYEINSRAYTGRGWEKHAVNPHLDKKTAFEQMVANAKLQSDNPFVMTRRTDSSNPQLFNMNKGVYEPNRITSWSAGRDAVGNKSFSGGKDRFVIKNKAGESNLLKNPYKSLNETQKQQYKTTLQKENPDWSDEWLDKSADLSDVNRTFERELLLPADAKLKQLGKVKNKIGGYDYVMRRKLAAGGSTNDSIETDIPEEEIQWYIDNGYIVEPVTKLKKFIG